MLLAPRYLALHGAPEEGLRPLRRFTLFVSVVTLALNVAEPLLARDNGKAAFDAVGPVLLIGWAEVGPGMLQSVAQFTRASRQEADNLGHGLSGEREVTAEQEPGDLGWLANADARHWAAYKRPISANTLRTELKISMDRARELVVALRSELAELVIAREYG